MSQKKKKTELQGVELFSAIEVLSQHGRAGLAELEKLKRGIEATNLSKAAMSVEKRAGFVFEEFAAGTFNASARKAGDYRTTASTGTNGGFGIDPRVDIKVERNGRVLVEAQAKCCRSPKRTAVSISKPKYAGTKRLVPAGQGEPVKKMLDASAAGKASSNNQRMREIGAARKEAAANVAERLEAGGHKSQKLSHKEAIKLATGDTSQIARQIVLESVGTAAVAGAKSGAAFSAGISALNAGARLARGGTTVTEAAKNVMGDAAIGAGRSAATAALAEGLRVGAKKVFSQSFKGGGPLAVAGCIIEVGSDAYKGELTVKGAAKSATRAAGGLAGAEAGAALGTAIFPGFGTVVGGILGGLAGSWLGGSW